MGAEYERWIAFEYSDTRVCTNSHTLRQGTERPRARARASLRRAMALTDATNAASAPTSAVKMNHLRARCATRPSSRRADATRRDDATTRRDANAD